MFKRLLFWFRSIGKPRCAIHPKMLLTSIPGDTFLFCPQCVAIAFDQTRAGHHDFARRVLYANRPKNAPVPLVRKDPE